MAQTGFTPIQIYRSSTASAAPTSGNLVAGELAINTADGKLFYLDNLNAVQVIGWKLVPATAGGTGLSTYTTGDIIYSSATNTLTKLGIGSTGQVLTVAGGVPTWAAGGGMVYPGAGIPNSTGSAWGTSYGVTGTGSVVLSESPTLTGNAGLGVTPIAWDSTYNSLQLGYAGSINGRTSTNDGMSISSNLKYTPTAKYINNGAASQYLQTGGGHTWLTSTGTNVANTNASLTEVMVLDNLGTLSLLGNLSAASGTFTGLQTVGGALDLQGDATSNQTIATAQTTGTLTIGGTGATGAITLGRSTGAQTVQIGGTGASIVTIGGATGTGTITLGRSTGAQTVNIATGANTASTKTVNIGTGGTFTTNITMGNTAGGGAITFGQSTGSQQINIGTGATLNATTKNIFIGTNGAVGSTTNIRIGNQARPLTAFIFLDGITTFGTSFSQTPVTVANLPSGGDAIAGDRYIVSNALAPTFGATVVGGGAVVIPVYYDGTNWKVG